MTNVTRSVLVAGGTGLIGERVVRQLIERGFTVYVITRYPEKLPASAIAIKVDMAESEWLSRCSLPAIDTVIYSAYSTSANRAYDERINRTAVEEMAIAVSCKHFIFLSTIGVFGSLLQDAEYIESSPKNPAEGYQKDKYGAGVFLQQQTRIPHVTILYCPIVYAEPSPRVDYYRDILRNGYFVFGAEEKGMYNITHAEDVASAAVLVATTPQAACVEEYIVTAETISFGEWVRTLETHFGYTSRFNLPRIFTPFVRGPIRRYIGKLGVRCPMSIPGSKARLLSSKVVFNSTKMKCLGWNPAFTLKHTMS